MDGGLPYYATQTGPGEYRVDVWVQPGAKRSEIAGEYQGRLKVRVAAPANDNKANKALAAYLAGLLGLRAAQVEVASGHASRSKTLVVRAQTTLPWPSGA